VGGEVFAAGRCGGHRRSDNRPLGTCRIAAMTL
jgi:hypothetical protein